MTPFNLLIVPVLSILVFVHELGHFVMAKRAGMKVEEFGFGFPPRLWGKQVGETTYSINWIPFGGFVKIFGEDGEHPDQARSFSVKGFWARFSVIVAGVVMNFLFAAIVAAVLNFGGVKMVTIESVVPDSPAAEAGIMPGDVLEGFATNKEAQKFVVDHKGQPIELHFQRSGAEFAVTMVPRVNPPQGQGALGVGFAKMYTPWYKAIPAGFKDAGLGVAQIVGGFVMVFRNIFTTGHVGVEFAGPLGIAVITGQVAKTGFGNLMSLMVFLSLNLAVINIMPFPALDGGRLLFLIIEKIKGSPLPKKVEGTLNTVGFLALILLMLLISVKDVLHYL